MITAISALNLVLSPEYLAAKSASMYGLTPEDQAAGHFKMAELIAAWAAEYAEEATAGKTRRVKRVASMIAAKIEDDAAEQDDMAAKAARLRQLTGE